MYPHLVLLVNAVFLEKGLKDLSMVFFFYKATIKHIYFKITQGDSDIQFSLPL